MKSFSIKCEVRISFLPTELSAQFDVEMNVIGDIEITEEEPHIKYGEKWSYVPKGNHRAIHDKQQVEEEPQFNSFQKESSSPDLRFQSERRT